MRGDPRSGSKVWEAPDREIGKPGENRGKVVAHRNFQPAAAFHDRQNRCNLALLQVDCRCAFSERYYCSAQVERWREWPGRSPLVARQPVFDRTTKVFGYELLFRDGSESGWLSLTGRRCNGLVR